MHPGITEGFLELLEQGGDADLVLKEATEVGHGNALLLHRVAVAQGDAAVCEGVVVNGDTERSTDGVLAALHASFVILAVLCFLAVAASLARGHHQKKAGCGTSAGSAWPW